MNSQERAFHEFAQFHLREASSLSASNGESAGVRCRFSRVGTFEH